MTNGIALVLGLLILLALIGDQIFWGGSNTFFVAREFTELLEWIAFWR